MSRYGNDITGLLDQMKTMEGPGGFTDTPSFKTTVRVIDKVACTLNYSTTLAARIVGRMEILISNEVYEDAPEEVDAFVDYAIDAFTAIVGGIERRYGSNAGAVFAEEAASRMSLKLA
jgi:hypothetical protein